MRVCKPFLMTIFMDILISSVDLFEFVRFIFDNSDTIVLEQKKENSPGGGEVFPAGGDVGGGDDGQLLDLVLARPQQEV